MQLEAVLHIPLSNFAYALDEHTLVIRLRTGKNDVKQCRLFYGDRVCVNDPVDVTEVVMERAAGDGLFDYYEAEISDHYTRVCYYFCLEDGKDSFFYSEYGFSEEMHCSRTRYFQFPYIRREDIPAIPHWAKEMVMYHIFPDSFASGREYLEDKEKCIRKSGKEYKSTHGGTLRGIIENVDYIRDLGVNCLYLNPVFAAESAHKYDTIDYFEIDPCFGTKEELKELCSLLHENGIRLILDGVFNHCGAQFAPFLDVREKEEDSQYRDWFYDMPFPVLYETPPGYEAFAYVKEMPKLNTGNPKVVEYFCRVGVYWIEYADIDGWRLDVANEINHEFWRSFRREVRKVKEDALLIGEIWENAEIWLLGDQFDSTMNYTFSDICREFFAEKRISVKELDEKINVMLFRYPFSVCLAQMNFLDTHDIPRFLSYCGGDKDSFRAAVFFLMTCVGIPSVFYGDEVCIEGIKEEEYRAPMPWGDRDVSMEKFFKRCIKMRRTLPALTRGNYRSALVDDEKKVYGFTRKCPEQEVLVLLSVSGERRRYPLPEKYQGRVRDWETKIPVKEEEVEMLSMEGRVFIVTQ